MKVLIGTKNNAKIQGAKSAFEKYFENVEVEGISVESNVNDQPVNEEIAQGAKNRVKNLKEYARVNNIDADYFVAIESGITNLLGDWEIVNAAAMEDKDGKASFGTSAGFPVPETRVNDIINTNLGVVMDSIFGDDSNPQKLGGVALLTHGKVSRIDLTEEAFIMCLTKYINESKWE